MFPVEEKIGEIKRHLAANREVVLAAPPGSGKTTCVASALLDEEWLAGRKIVMLEPRRLAAKNCATFMAARLGEAPGGTVGYQVRLERKIGPDTRLEVVTEGLLAQRIMSNPELDGVGAIVFDEFHERSLACDLSFALALEVKRALREDLRIVVMSATLDVDETAKLLDKPAIVEAQGRMFPVETIYLGDISMAAAVRRALRETAGDILCFLPGESEIRRTMEALEGVDANVMALYGRAPREQQDAVFAPCARRKAILATSIAETSLTIPGITCVIDSGLMRTARFSPATGMDALVTLPLPMDRAEQRRGRAGRTASGICYRLWDKAKEGLHPARSSPEVLHADLASTVLASVAWGAPKRDSLPWPTPPPSAAWDEAARLLRSLGALDASGRPTAKGTAMAGMPMHPRLANMLLHAGGGDTAALLAAIIEEPQAYSSETDIRKTMDETRQTPSRAQSKRILRLADNFAAAFRRAHGGALRTPGGGSDSEGALLAMAYPDRIARNRGNGSFVMTCGRGAAIDRADALAKAPFLVCCKLDARAADARIFLAAPIKAEEIESLFAESIRESWLCEWDRRTDRVRSVKRRMLEAMPVEENACIPDGDEAAGKVLDALMEGVRIKGVENLPCWTKQSRQTRDRLAFLARRCAWPAADDGAIAKALRQFAAGMTKWSDLGTIDMERVFDAMLAATGKTRRDLDRLAPQRLKVPSGSELAVDYSGEEPSLCARLQECFGMMDTPSVAGGTVKVVMTLLSPAQRPVQITKDLAGFWREGYALARKDLRGRYPRHYWPEDPFSAVATRRVRPRQ